MIFCPHFDVTDEGGGLELNTRLQQFNMEVAATMNVLSDRVEGLNALIIGTETVHRTLVSESQHVVVQVISQAKREFEAHGAASASLRAAIEEVVAQARAEYQAQQKKINASQAATQGTHDAARGEFSLMRKSIAELQVVVREQQQALDLLEDLVA